MQPTPNDPQLWLIPFIVVAFAITFTTIWSFVCFLLATMSGYRSLASQFRVEESVFQSMEALPTPFYAMIGMSSYRGGLLALRADRTGLALRVWKLFPFHPAMRIPWERVGRAEGGATSFASRLGVGGVVLDGRVTLRASGEILAAIDDAQRRYSAAQSGWASQ